MQLKCFDSESSFVVKEFHKCPLLAPKMLRQNTFQLLTPWHQKIIPLLNELDVQILSRMREDLILC